MKRGLLPIKFKDSRTYDLLDIFPSFSSNNISYSRPIHIEYMSHFFMGEKPRHCPNFNNLFGREFCPTSSFSAKVENPNSNTMSPILKICTPLKIFNSIVPFIAIYMVYLRQVFRIWNKSNGNKTMNSKVFFQTILRESYVFVSIKMPSLFKKMAFTALSSTTPNSSIFSNSIKSLVTFYISHVFPRKGHTLSRMWPSLVLS